MVNVSIDVKLYKKNCGSPAEANELFNLVLKAKTDPSDKNIKAIRSYLNEKLRIALVAGLETDPDNNEVFLAGFSTPLPMTLVEVIKEYHENGYPLEAIINFWKLLMINPDVRVRESLFDFITTHDFVLTDKGYMIVYKAVYPKDNGVDAQAKAFAEFVSNQYLHVKKDWGCAPSKYVVYKDLENQELLITKKETAEKWNEKERNVEILGGLADLFNSIFNTTTSDDEKLPAYTDMYSRTMTIELGKLVRMERIATATLQEIVHTVCIVAQQSTLKALPTKVKV